MLHKVLGLLTLNYSTSSPLSDFPFKTVLVSLGLKNILNYDLSILSVLLSMLSCDVTVVNDC